MGSLGAMSVLGVRVGFASGIFSPWRYTLTCGKKKKEGYYVNMLLAFIHLFMYLERVKERSRLFEETLCCTEINRFK